MFKMSFAQEKLEGKKSVPSGLYKVRFGGFKPKLSSNNPNDWTKSNLNAYVNIISPDEFADSPLYANLNLQIPSFIQDFVHSFGLEMEGQDSDNPEIPGIFDADAAKFIQEKPETWVYAGPLTNKIAMWEVSEGSYQGKPKTDVVKFVCSVQDCGTRFLNVRHASDMRKKS
jgi:hypothetical protein